MAPRRRHRSAPALVAAALLAVAAAAAAVVLAPRPESPAREDRDPVAAHGPVDESAPALRTVLLTEDQHAVSKSGRFDQAFLLRGEMPQEPVEGVVLTDENCAPDAEGVSHCRNDLRLANGQMVTVIHNHRMAEVPCFTPGEHVLLAAGV